MKRLTEKYERFLRIDQVGNPELAMRLRAIWIVGWMFIITQVLNLAVMSFNYGSWTYDQTIGVTVIIFIACSIQFVRWYQNSSVYALFYSTLMVAACLGSALPEHTGINSALVTLIALGPVMNGFIAGRKAAILFWVVGSAVLTYLFWHTLQHPSAHVDGLYVKDLNRFSQGIFSISFAMVMSVMLSEKVYSTLRDQTLSTARAKRAEAAKSEFLATMSHELRTPLNGVIGLTDTLMNGNLAEREKHLTKTIRNSGEALLAILNDLLDLSKIEAGKLSIEKRPADVKNLMETLYDNWHEAAATKNLDFIVNVNGPLPEAVMCDDLRIRQILQNMISNGIKFTSVGSITVQLDCVPMNDDHYTLEFRVSDTGKGIPDSVGEQVFEAFEQGEQGITREYGGTGLGLPICRMLANLMGGTVGIEKTNPAGTTFLFKIDVQRTEPIEQLAPRQVLSQKNVFVGLKILVAEDNQVNRMVVGEFLKTWQVDFAFAVNGSECVEMAQAQLYDIILMDKHMPIMDGIAATQAIRRLSGPISQIPIIAVTADAMSGEREHLLDIGMNDFIAKPIRAETLYDVLHRVLKNSKAA